VRARNGAQSSRIMQTSEEHKFVHVVLVRAPRFIVSDVGEPFEFRGYVGESGELGRS
jgi:hypothetical protein